MRDVTKPIYASYSDPVQKDVAYSYVIRCSLPTGSIYYINTYLCTRNPGDSRVLRFSSMEEASSYLERNVQPLFKEKFYAVKVKTYTGSNGDRFGEEII